MSISRRGFLRSGAGVVAASVALPAAGLQVHSSRDRALVIIELNGGNDALNTVIPIGSRHYVSARPTLAIRNGLMLDRGLALHPAMGAMHQLYRQGKLAIVQGIGYPNPSRSHFRSMEIWHRGHVAVEAQSGWLAGYIQHLGSASAIHCGFESPEMFRGTGAASMTWVSADDVQNGFEENLARFAKLIAQDSPARLFHVGLGGFDTHARQAETHAALLGRLSSGIGQFMTDLKTAGRDRDVLVVVFSEFGRRLRENSSAGTDHGSAGVMFLAGGGARGGLYGRYPSLTDLNEGDLKHTTDFRDCYAAVLRDWLNCRSDRGVTRGVKFV